MKHVTLTPHAIQCLIGGELSRLDGLTNNERKRIASISIKDIERKLSKAFGGDRLKLQALYDAWSTARGMM